MHILFATAELRPLVRVGGLAEATAGLVKELQRIGTDVTVVLPDYGLVVMTDTEFVETDSWELDVPDWAGPARARRGRADSFNDVVLIDRPGLNRPHPYVEPLTGEAWGDNDDRFWAFSAAIAAVTQDLQPDVLHLNDWHTAGAMGFLSAPPPTVLTIHTLGYQGVCGANWLSRVPHESWRFSWYDVANPLVGAIRSADKIIAVSPNYASEILTPEHGMGMHEELARRDGHLVGIRNGIDTGVWDPASDPHLPATYDVETLEVGKAAARTQLIRAVNEAGASWDDDGAFLMGVVTRLVDQKGVDHVAALAPYLEDMGARIVLLGSGLPELADLMQRTATAFCDRVAAVTDKFDEPLAHLIFGGSDLFLMPSRFEPCGLAQMQAMVYGTPPVATSVGGLVDTITDADTDLAFGTGFLARTNDLPGFVDAVHRGIRALRTPDRFERIAVQGMSQDWSWADPAQLHLDLYANL